MPVKANTYDAIVVGSGMTGGWAAKELCEKGLKTLVLERGREVKHIQDYPTTNQAPWEFSHRGHLTREEKEQYHIQSNKYNFDASSKHFYVNDLEHPYAEEKPFRWFRGYQTGGRSLLWGRGAYRMSDLDFEANAKDGMGIDWPIRYKDIAPWYDYVEQFIGVAGSQENIWHFPDGVFLPPFDMNKAELVIKKRIESHYPHRKFIPNRVAHLTKVEPGQFKGRTQCQSRDMCHRGCPFGAYFSSNSSTLPAAAETGNMILRPHAIVESVLYDENQDKVTGVRIIDAQTKQSEEFYAKVVFLCASALATTGILLSSKTSRFSEGLANSSGVLGHYLMDHHANINAYGTLEGYEDRIYKGFRPAAVALPRFRNVEKQEMDYLRGYGFWGGAARQGINPAQIGIGADYKVKVTQPGPWRLALFSQAEGLPYYGNTVTLDPDKKDKWGLPLLKINAEHGENERLMRKDMFEQAQEVMEVAGLQDIVVENGPMIMGDVVHEMGTARMGNDPKESVLNGFNQCHDIPNLFITDGSCMPSSGYVSPSLTYMALTARACDYAVRKMKNGEL